MSEDLSESSSEAHYSPYGYKLEELSPEQRKIKSKFYENLAKNSLVVIPREEKMEEAMMLKYPVFSVLEPPNETVFN